MCWLFILFLVFLSGCAAPPPRIVALSELALNPELFKNTTVQFTGFVKENKYIEMVLGRWELTVTDGQYEIYCFKEGYNLSLLRHGAKLAEEAKEGEGAVTVTGKPILLHGLRPMSALEIERLNYKDISVYVKPADYPLYYYYGPYYGPRRPFFSRPLIHRYHR